MGKNRSIDVVTFKITLKRKFNIKLEYRKMSKFNKSKLKFE